MQLEFALALPVIKHQPVGKFGVGRQRLCMTKPDAVNRLSVQFEFERQVLFTDDSLADHLYPVVEQRRGKALAPDLVLQFNRHIRPSVRGGQRSVGFQRLRQRGRVQPLRGNVLQRGFEGG